MTKETEYKVILGTGTALGLAAGVAASSFISVPMLACYALLGGTGLGAGAGLAVAESATKDGK